MQGGNLPIINLTDSELELLVDILDKEVDAVEHCANQLCIEPFQTVDEFHSVLWPVVNLKHDIRDVRTKLAPATRLGVI